MKTFKSFISEVRLPKFSVFKQNREGGHIHIDDFDTHGEAKQEALLSSAEDPHVDHMIVHNPTSTPVGIFKGGRHQLHEKYLEEGKPKTLNPNASYHYNDIHRILTTHGWTLERSAKHLIYRKEGEQRPITVSLGKGEIKRDQSSDIIKKVLKHLVKKDD